MTALPDYVSFKEFAGFPLRECFPAASDELLHVISGLLRYNPGTRSTAAQVRNLFPATMKRTLFFANYHLRYAFSYYIDARFLKCVCVSD